KILNELTEEGLKADIAYKNLKGLDFSTPLFEILLHVANHATYHRGQAASLIRRIKGSPPVTDMIEYFRSKSAG
ncbi:MAG TPA: DinB family protein, partial [Leptospiraceae bacterium]|nr:DinB family protein [Leptospiraceae bacterium]